MEDDDEFGDLYTDVLRPLSAASHPHQISPPASSSVQRPIDLNLKSNDQVPPQPTSIPDSTPPRVFIPVTQLPVSHVPSRAEEDCDFAYNNDVKVKFDIEEGNIGISNDDDGAGIEIPGISQNVVIKEEGQNEGLKRNDVGEEDDDWESDSEDDLQIVLNEENHRPMLIEEGGGDDDDDEDGDPLVIVGDVDASNHQLLVEEQDWGGDDVAAQMGDGGAEKKEGTIERANVAAAAAATATAKIGYSNHFAYHNPYHSQFKVSFT